jgi:ribosomal protein L37AE/L43A
MADRSKKADKALECPVCHGTKVTMAGRQKSSIVCAECGTLIAGPSPKPKARVSAPGTRHRRDNGPAELLVQPVAPPSPAEIGPGHHFTTLILEGGERGVIAAEHEATRLSEKFGEEIEAEWCLATTWLKSLTDSTRPRTDAERQRYALQWRPRFLAIVSLTRSVILGSRGARVAYNTVKAHRRDDVEFDAQVLAAQDRAVELLHDVTFRDAVEGWMEPVFWQGIRIGSIRKFDNRLRVEMLRAHMPRTFKTPGQQTSINIGAGAGSIFQQNNVIVDAGARDELVKLRQEALQEIARGREKAVSVVSETTLP